MTAAEALLERARAAGATIATAESCTAGMVSAALTDPAGASAVFDRGFVTYSNAAKTDLLGVPQALLEAHGAVSEAVARAMAEGALARSAASHAVAVTGIAGPGGGTEEKPEGLVWFALAEAGGTDAECVEFGARGRDEVRRGSVAHALAILTRAVAG